MLRSFDTFISSNRETMEVNTPPAKIARSGDMCAVHDNGLVHECPNAANGGARATTMPTVTARSSAPHTLTKARADLTNLPKEIQKTIWRQLDNEALCEINLVCKAVMASAFFTCQSAQLERHVASNCRQTGDVVSRLELQWEKYRALPPEERRVSVAKLVKSTWHFFASNTGAQVEAGKGGVARHRALLEQAAALLEEDKCFGNAGIFLSLAYATEEFLQGDIDTLHKYFEDLPECQRAAVFALLKSRFPMEQRANDSCSKQLSAIMQWTEKTMTEPSFRKMHAEALIETLSKTASLYQDQRWLNDFFALTRHHPDEVALNFNMLCRYIDGISQAKLSIAPFIAGIEFIKSLCPSLPDELDASLRYRLRTMCLFQNRPPLEAQNLLDRTECGFFSDSKPASDAQRREILLSSLHTAIANQSIGNWIDLYRELPKSERFALLMAVQRSNFDGFQSTLRVSAVTRISQLFLKFPDDLLARLLENSGGWYFFVNLNVSARIPHSWETCQRVKKFSPDNKHVALCGMARAIEYANDEHAEHHARATLKLAENLPAELKANVAVAILQAQQARLRKAPPLAYQKIALLAQDLRGESAEAVLRELRACQAIMVEQGSLVSAENQ